MAFNKDRGRISTMNQRQAMHRSSKRAPKTGGGGKGAPFYVNRYAPPKTGSSDIIRLIPGEYVTPRVDFDARDFMRDEEGNVITDKLSFFKYISYYKAISQDEGRSLIGSEGPLGEFKGKGEPCLAADWFWYEWRVRTAAKAKKPNSISRREMFALTVLVQAPFYKVPQTDGNGQFKMNPATNEPYYDWVKGSKRGNDDLAAGNFERKEGHLQHWSLGSGHWKVLSEYGDSLAKHCRNCCTHNSIVEVALICQNPECGEAVVEFDSTALSDEDLFKVRNEEVTCPHCQFVGYLEDVIRCTSCDNGEQATLFDFDLEVKRTVTTNNGDTQTALNILSAIGPRPIDDMYGEDLRKPLPLEKIFAPTSPEKQLEILGPLPAAQPSGGGTGSNTGSPQRTPSTKGARSYGA